MKAYSEIHDLKSQLGVTVKVAAAAKPYVDIVVPVFYVAVTLLYWYGVAKANSFVSYAALMIVPMIAGVVLAFVAGSYNPLWFLIIGFAQPVLTSMVLVLLDVFPIQAATRLARPLFMQACRTGLFVTGAGLVAMLVARSGRTPPVALELKTGGWTSLSDSELDRLGKIIVMIATIVTPLITLLSLFLGKE